MPKIFWMLSLVISCKFAFAEIVVERNARTMTASIGIHNRILHNESQEFSNELFSLERDGYKIYLATISLNTGGGNPDEAMKIGRIIRERNLNTYVAPKSSCRSACIYILIGGTIRMAYGTIKVHRTSFDDDYPIEKLEKDIKIDNDAISKYIHAMGISWQLTDVIIQTPYWDAIELTPFEKKRWGIHGFDRINEELWFRKTSTTYNINHEELVSFYATHHKKCDAKARAFQTTIPNCIEDFLKSSKYLK